MDNMNNLSDAFQLLIVGMLTVFCILFIVIYFGKLLIFLVNKYAPEAAAKPAKVAATSNTTVDPKTMSIIEATINQLTAGKGKVAKVEKL